MHFIIVISMLAAFWVYRDAQKFGYQKNIALLWALGTIVLFWVVFPIYLLLGRKFQVKNKQKQNKKIEQATIEADAVSFEAATAECPMCAKSVQEDATKCPYCGYTLTLFCANCGEALERQWQHCPHCQAKSPEK